MQVKPLDALLHAIMSGFAYSGSRKPGAIIARMSAADREALQRLTSDDIAQVRVPGARNTRWRTGEAQ